MPLICQTGGGEGLEPALQLAGDEPAAAGVGFEEGDLAPPPGKHQSPGDTDAAASGYGSPVVQAWRRPGHPTGRLG